MIIIIVIGIHRLIIYFFNCKEKKVYLTYNKAYKINPIWNKRQKKKNRCFITYEKNSLIRMIMLMYLNTYFVLNPICYR